MAGKGEMSELALSKSRATLLHLSSQKLCMKLAQSSANDHFQASRPLGLMFIILSVVTIATTDAEASCDSTKSHILQGCQAGLIPGQRPAKQPECILCASTADIPWWDTPTPQVPRWIGTDVVEA